MFGHNGKGTMIGATYTGFGNGSTREEALKDFITSKKLNKKYSYDIVVAKLKPNSTDRWYFELYCKG